MNSKSCLFNWGFRHFTLVFVNFHTYLCTYQKPRKGLCKSTLFMQHQSVCRRLFIWLVNWYSDYWKDKRSPFIRTKEPFSRLLFCCPFGAKRRKSTVYHRFAKASFDSPKRKRKAVRGKLAGARKGTESKNGPFCGARPQALQRTHALPQTGSSSHRDCGE